MKLRFLCCVILCGWMTACSSDPSHEQEAERMLLSARDLEEDIETLTGAIDRYAEISAKFPKTESAGRAEKRQSQLVKVQEMLSAQLPPDQDSLVAHYERVATSAPGYFAILKKLGTIYYNQTDLLRLSAIKTRLVPMKDRTIEIWGKQDALWSQYEFRPIQSNRLWQDNLCRQAVGVAEMLVNQVFSDFDLANVVVTRGLHYGNSEDVLAKGKVVAAFCAFRKGKTESLKEGINLAQEALAYEFLSTEDRARAYHVIGLCYTYLHQDSRELADLDAAIKALNECVNVDSEMSEARDLLKTLRQMRDRMPS